MREGRVLFLIITIQLLSVLFEKEVNSATNTMLKYDKIENPKNFFFTSKYSIFHKKENLKNDTSDLDVFLGTNKKVYFPAGDYYFDINRIELDSNTTLTGDGDNTRFHILDNATFKSANPDALFVASGKSNVHVFNIKFIGRHNTSVALKAYSSQAIGRSENISMKYNTTEKMGLIWVSPKNGFTFNRIDEQFSSWGQNGPITEHDISGDVDIAYNTIIGDTAKNLDNFYNQQASGVSLLFTENSKVYKNTISHVYFGIWAYGGGSLSSGKEHLTQNPIWCKDIEFTDNKIDTTFSPLWASRCRNVRIDNNYAKDNLDVAVDFEGCIDSSARGNTVINSHGGALTPLNGCDNIVFENNIVESNHESVYGINITLIRNANRDVTYLNNTFRAVGFSKGKIQMTRTHKAIEGNKNIVFKNNIFENIYKNNKDGSSIEMDITNKGLPRF